MAQTPLAPRESDKGGLHVEGSTLQEVDKEGGSKELNCELSGPMW